jgi:ferredoxin
VQDHRLRRGVPPYAQKWPNITAKKDMPKDARAHWDETGKFDKYFSAKPGEGD